MSHFVGICFGEYWESDLERYAEDLEVDPYILYTREEAIKNVQDTHNLRYDTAQKRIKDYKGDDEYKQILLDTLAKGPTLTPEDAWEIVKEWGYKIDEDDNVLSTYNPDAKWDWYVIGGRWSNYLYLKERDEEGERLTADYAYFDEVDWDYMIEMNHIPFCFVDWDGDWHEKGEMGWFAMTKNEKDDDSWVDEFKAYIETLKNVEFQGEVTVIDFHI
jgi:hypothetical protein